jgi:hypothetical protein
MVIPGRQINYPEIGVALGITRYTLTGDSINRTLSTASLTSDTYARRHLIIKGSFEITFNEIPTEIDTVNINDIWPPIDERKTKFFTVTALEDGSEYLCIIPKNGGLVKQKTDNIKSSETMNVEQGKVIVVMGPCTVNGVDHSPQDVIVSLNGPAVIVAKEDMDVHQFWNSKFSN